MQSGLGSKVFRNVKVFNLRSLYQLKNRKNIPPANPHLASRSTRVKKTAYKRNAFGNHSKGIINLNLKLNYEKTFRLAAIIFWILPMQKMYQLLMKDNKLISLSFWWCKGKNYLLITKYFFINIFLIQINDKLYSLSLYSKIHKLLIIRNLNLCIAEFILLNLVRSDDR